MNILVHAMPTKMGGAKRHLDHMMKALATLGAHHRFHLVINDRYDISAFDPAIRIHTFPIAASNGAKRLWLDNVTIPRLIETERIDLLISFANIGPFKAPCPHILFEMNALYFCHDIRHLYRLTTKLGFTLKRAMIRRCANHADAIVTPSRSLKEQILETTTLPEERFHVIPHAIDRRFCDVEAPATLFDPDKLSFLYPSHLARHKGVHLLLEALVRLKERHPEVLPRFEILCTFARDDEPDYYDELITFITANGLSDLIRFIGHQPQEAINALYAAADYMIYTTLCESFGFAMLEAKVFHLPALCSDIPVNREIAGRSAIYYRSNAPDDLAEKLLDVVRTKPARETFDFADELLDWKWEDYAHRLLSLIEKVAHG